MTDLTPVDRAPATRDTHLSDAAWDLIDEATPDKPYTVADVETAADALVRAWDYRDAHAQSDARAVLDALVAAGRLAHDCERRPCPFEGLWNDSDRCRRDGRPRAASGPTGRPATHHHRGDAHDPARNPDGGVQMKELIGGLLCLLPFVGLTALMVRDGGWRTALHVWGLVAAMVMPIALGCWLLLGQQP